MPLYCDHHCHKNTENEASIRGRCKIDIFFSSLSRKFATKTKMNLMRTLILTIIIMMRGLRGTKTMLMMTMIQIMLMMMMMMMKKPERERNVADRLGRCMKGWNHQVRPEQHHHDGDGGDDHDEHHHHHGDDHDDHVSSGVD